MIYTIYTSRWTAILSIISFNIYEEFNFQHKVDIGLLR